MRALGRAGMPGAIVVNDVRYDLARAVKHDFFAATGFYEDGRGRRVVLKMSRTQEFAGVPLRWLGRRLCRRELSFYSKLNDLRAVPKVLATVGDTGFVLEYVPGTPFSTLPRVSDGFFDELQALFRMLHQRGLAYVDADKSQNILAGDDGRPHLIDFQISFDVESPRRFWMTEIVLTLLQRSDVYHLLKHKARLRPDQLSAAERRILERRSWPIRLHRFLLKPYFGLRRRTFQRLRETGRLLPEGSK